MNNLIGVAFVLLAAVASAQVPVVPGAVGYGMQTRAAYGCGSDPAILRVTNLNDSGQGSLRSALTAAGPRVVIFEVSGYIAIDSDIIVENPCLTIAGQTAPSPGITLRASAGMDPEKIILTINTHDVLLQHIRIRPGGDSCNSGALVVYSYPRGQAVAQFYNVVFDHVSSSWGQDEGLYAGRTDANGGLANVTFWRSIAAEGLWDAPGTRICGGALNGEAANGHGIFIEGQHVDVIQSLFAHNRERNPMIDGRSSARLLNNLIYGWQGEWGIFLFNKQASPGPWFLTAVGNRFIVGPQSNNPGVGGAVLFWFGAAYPDASFEDRGNQIYRNDNTVDNQFRTPIIPTMNRQSYNPDVTDVPAQTAMPEGYRPLQSADLEQYLVPKVGARPVDRDAVDTRILADLANRRGGFIALPSDVGGYPALAVNHRSLMIPTNPHAVQGSGYTVLEEWLHGMADAVEGGAAAPTITPPAILTSVRVTP